MAKERAGGAEDGRLAGAALIAASTAVGAAGLALVEAAEQMLIAASWLADDRGHYKGRALPAGYRRCGGGGHCGSVITEYKDHRPYKYCSAGGGNCAEEGCACHLFRYPEPEPGNDHKNDPWEHWFDPQPHGRNESKLSPQGYHYECICVDVAV